MALGARGDCRQVFDSETGGTGNRLDVLVAAPYPSVQRGLLSLLAEFPDLAPRSGAQFEEPEFADQPDVVVAYQPAAATGQELVEFNQILSPLVLVVEGLLSELPQLSARPLAVLPAESDGQTLHAAVIAVARGLTVIDTTFAAGAGISWRQPLVPQGERFDLLTSREMQVLQLVARGLPNKTIAAELGISEHTVKFHVGSILSKLGAESRTEAVTVATRRGLVVI